MYRLKLHIIFSALLFCTLASGCDKSPHVGAEENIAAFFQTVEHEQLNRKADPNHLVSDPISILDDRLFLRMPEGASVMSEEQEVALGILPLDKPLIMQRVVWGGSNEILTLDITEQLETSDTIEREMSEYLISSKTWESAEIIEINKNAVAVSLPYAQISSTREGKLEFMRAMVYGAGHTLLRIEFSLYTTAFDQAEERVAFFREVALSIVESASPVQ